MHSTHERAAYPRAARDAAENRLSEVKSVSWLGFRSQSLRRDIVMTAYHSSYNYGLVPEFASVFIETLRGHDKDYFDSAAMKDVTNFSVSWSQAGCPFLHRVESKVARPEYL